MREFETGMLAMSKAGHDKNQIYIISRVEDAYVYLVDGKIRTLDRPKKKKKKHIQIITKTYDISAMDDVAIKRLLKSEMEEA